MNELNDKKVYVAGHRGLVGAAIMDHLDRIGANMIVTKTSKELDLRDQAAVRSFFAKERPAVVFLAAAKVGGIHANNVCRAEFIYDNLMIAANVIDAAYRNQCEWLLNLGSSCIYPKFAQQPIDEAELLKGPLEQTNEPYAIAKIAALKLVESYNRQYGTRYFSAMPTNLYGPNDNFDPEGSHVIPALIRRFHDAKAKKSQSVSLWGDGTPMREFLHVKDLANAAIHLYDVRKQISPEQYFLNIGTGSDVSIADLARIIKDVVGFEGRLEWDTTKPNGTPRKLLNVSLIKKTGWEPSISLLEGLKETYRWYIEALNKGLVRNQ